MKKFIENIKKNKKLTILSILIIGVAFLLVTRITYAYLAPIISNPQSTDIGGSVDYVDDFMFEFSNPLNVNATPTTLPENGENYVTSTVATAKLKANLTNNSANYTYYLYLSITDNTFEYIKAGKPEMLLTITDPTGEELTSLGSLTYKTYEGVSGFDITTATGDFTLADGYAISSNSSTTYTEQNWIITITYMNQDFDQSANFGKSVKTSLTYKKYGIPKVNRINLTSTPTSVTATVSANAAAESVQKYYYSLNDADYIESTSNKHTFDNLDSSTNYKVSVKVLNSDGNESSVVSNNINTKNYVLPRITKVTSTVKWNKITLVVTSYSGTNNVAKYMYSINGEEYKESLSNTYSFNNLTANTTYTIKTKVVDTYGKESTERTDTITTKEYVAPKVIAITSIPTINSIKIIPDIQLGSDEISKYFYSINNGSSYIESTASSYTFTNLNVGTYNIKVYVKDSNGNLSNVYSSTISTYQKLSDRIMQKYLEEKEEEEEENESLNIYYHNSSLEYGANDNSYRYAGANPYNYVCFGSNASTCPDDNLYRIIGVFNGQVKLIKADYSTSNLLGINGTYSSDVYKASDFSGYKNNPQLSTINRYSWGNSNNSWNTSALNLENLNNYYLENIGSVWADKIATTTWKIGGNTLSNMSDCMEKIYQNEILTPATSMTYSAKIGLMYVSDYGFAAKMDYWTYSSYLENGTYDYRKAINDNWMYRGVNEWTITPQSDSNTSAFYIASVGNVNNSVVSNAYAIRPVFYLKNDTPYVSGDGFLNSPYRIEKSETLSTYVKNQYTGTQGQNGIYYHNGSITDDEGNVIDARDSSYRYTGANPNNYICFGSDAKTCPEENLYRIIGTFNNKVKVIKADYATAKQLGGEGVGDYKNLYSNGSDKYKGEKYNYVNITSYYWNKANSSATNTATGKYNVWSYSKLYTENLNNYYLSTYLPSAWASKISTTSWKVGGNTGTNIMYTPLNNAYGNEITNPNTTIETSVSSKIGLMYVSDYGYAASPSYWTTKPSAYSSSINENWMHMGLYEWTITRASNYNYNAYTITANGVVSNHNVDDYGYAVRPVFYIGSSVMYVSGTGSKNSPIRLS